MSKNKAGIAKIRQFIGETELQVSTLEIDLLNEVVEHLREVQNEIYDLEEKRRSALDVLNRSEIRAPIKGVVLGLQIHTLGGVISPGQQVLGIVPSEDGLIIETKIDPQDIDVVRPGLKAHVRFTAFSSRTHLPVEAKVVNISADRFTDKRSGAGFYKAKVVLTGDLGNVLQGESLYPGMQAEVMIVTGSRTPLDYLLAPLTEGFNRAFRES